MTKASNIKSSTDSINKKQIIEEDALGRKLTIERPPYLSRLRFIKCLGDELTSNRAYMNEISFIIWLKAIDDQKVIQPGSENELEAIIQRLDNEGMEALTLGVYKLLGIDLNKKIDEKAREEKEIDQAKK